MASVAVRSIIAAETPTGCQRRAEKVENLRRLRKLRHIEAVRGLTVLVIASSVAVVWLGSHAPFSQPTFPTFSTQTGRHSLVVLVRHYRRFITRRRSRLLVPLTFYTGISARRFPILSNLRPRFAILKLGGRVFQNAHRRSSLYLFDLHAAASSLPRPDMHVPVRLS